MAKLSPKKIADSVRELARIASVMFDGEICSRIVTERSWQWFASFDPDDRWSSHDNYDVEHAPFLAAKHTLMRLERLAPEGLRVGCSLWLPIPTLPGKCMCVVQNGGPARWQQFGTLQFDITPEMQKAFAGEPAALPPTDSGVNTVLAPVRDSLKEVVGFIEISAAVAAPAIPW